MRETFIPRNLIVTIQSVLHKGLRPWFAEIFFAALVAYGPISEWIRKSCNEKKYRKFYHSVQRFGRFDEKIQNVYSTWLVKAFKSSLQEADSVRLALDDSPIKRYGPKIEGAGYMHDPTNDTGKNAVCYGHSWVVISLIVKHAQWGTISLPFRWNYYIRKDDLEQIDKVERPEFKTKPQIGIALLNQVVVAIKKVTNKPIQLAFDSGYVSSELFEAAASLGVEVITRFKKNSNFYTLPVRTATVKRGRPRKYGEVFKLGNVIEDNICVDEYIRVASIDLDPL